MKSFFPKVCPSCQQPLIVEVGDKSDTLKLMCKNKLCCGSLLKRLQKGIIALEIRGLGPKVIENLMNAGISSTLDLFDPETFNEKVLISSGYFRKGRSLEKIMDAVKSTKSIPIHKAILSLQIDDIGKTFSEKIGQKLSGMEVDFSGLQYNIREQLEIEGSELNILLQNSIEKFEKFGVEIIKTEVKKVFTTEVKKVTKIVDISGFSDKFEVLDVIQKLGWYYDYFETLPTNCQLLIVSEKDLKSKRVDEAKENGVKIMTLKQIKLLFC